MKTQIDKVIFKYLDNQDFIITGNNISLFFVNSESDKHAQIRYDKDNGWCFINTKLIKEISSFFSLKESDSEEVIGRWVENTLQNRVTNTGQFEYIIHTAVENTLQNRVTNTVKSHHHFYPVVENTLQNRVTNTAQSSNKSSPFIERILQKKNPTTD